MAKRKTEFELNVSYDMKCREERARTKIHEDISEPYISIDVLSRTGATLAHTSFGGKSLETFALNILKAIGSKHLKK